MMVKEQLGATTPDYNKRFYNSRDQLAEIRASTSYTGPTHTTWDRGAIVNSYSNLATGQCGFPSELAINGTGRYVRVQLVGTNYLSIAEVQVWTGATTTPVQWLISDQLGSPRMILDHTGSLANMKRHDYLPFGEELVAPTGGRSAAKAIRVVTVCGSSSLHRNGTLRLDWITSSPGDYFRPAFQANPFKGFQPSPTKLPLALPLARR